MADSTAINKEVTLSEFRELLKIDTLVELIQREVRVSPSPNFQHQEVIGAIFLLLKTMEHSPGSAGMSPTVIFLDDETVVRPDIFWVKADSPRCQLKDDGYWHGVPDLIVEVLDPTTEARDRGIKFDLYARSGVREYWMVNPQAEFVETFLTVSKRLTRQGLYQPGHAFNSGILHGASIDPEQFFHKQPISAGQ